MRESDLVRFFWGWDQIQIENSFWDYPTFIVLLTIDNYDQIIQMKEEFMGLRQKLDKLIRLL